MLRYKYFGNISTKSAVTMRECHKKDSDDDYEDETYKKVKFISQWYAYLRLGIKG